ncbi:hypothetical protein ATCC49503_11950 [Helicobacter pylori]|nr:hypothetical protein [Helicobacter pylori]BEE29675.1 hypothetical protein ATCC49503_11950 [Helicobacter pylori]
MERVATKKTNPTLEPIAVTKGERLELQKNLYNYIIKKWNNTNQDKIPLNRVEISQAIGCEVHRVSNIVNSLIDKGLIEMDRIKKRNVDIYNVFKIRTATNYDLNHKQQDILIYLHHRKGAYNCDELASRVAMEYFPMLEDLKDLKSRFHFKKPLKIYKICITIHF